ncbi:MAG: LuxR C-terminal-related transcriptional regulator [Candidatus Pristimantibacillus sp.]
MSIPILSSKLYIPPPRSKRVTRQRLIHQLNEGLSRKVTLISASAGFGKTTLLSEWLSDCDRPIAWLSLDEGDNDQARFLTYLIAAMQTIRADIGEGVSAVLQSPQPPPIESILTILINEIGDIFDPFVLILDDYHVINADLVNNALSFLIEHLPSQMHVVIATREDPMIPLARLRARNHLTELRVADLRFTTAEATGFLNQVMGLNLSSIDVELLETRTEGWIVGLQLAAISIQGLEDAASFIKSFTGSHRFVLDYLVEEVLQQQSEPVQTFLLRTSTLDRMCGPLCDAVLGIGAWGNGTAAEFSQSGQEILQYLERINLFIIPLDNERRWYRYHHLFADLLRQRLREHQSTASSTGTEGMATAELHIQASIWYEDNALEIDAFHHAVLSNDVDRAARLMDGGGMPLHFRGAVVPVLNWLESLPSKTMDSRPSLWVTYASVLLFINQIADVEQKLLAAEAALEDIEPDDKIQDLIGHIASIRATLAVSQHHVEVIISQSLRALAYLHPDNLPIRTATSWTLGYAYQLQGDRAAASMAYKEAISSSISIGHTIITIMASIGLGNIQETENQLEYSAQTYRNVLQMAGDPPMPAACEAYLGLARIFYEWNDLDAAEHYVQQSVQLARQIEHTDRFLACEIFHARLKLAKDDISGAAAILYKASQYVHERNFIYRMPEVVIAQVNTMLQQGNLDAAAQLALTYELPLSQARVQLAQGDTSTALAVLEPLRQQAVEKKWRDEQLKVMVLQAVVLYAHGDKKRALQLLGEALTLAEPGGFIRIFVDEGIPMARLLSEAANRGMKPDYIGKLLAVFEAGEKKEDNNNLSYLHGSSLVQSLIEPLSKRELIVLQYIAQGLSNHEISERLFLALSTVKGHNRIIFDKLQVQRRTEAVARARELGLI